MATVVRNLAELIDGRIRWSYSYDDQNFRLLSFDCINASVYPSTGTVRSQSDPTAFVTKTVLPGTELHEPVPVGVANRFNIGVDARGRLTGIDHAFTWG